MYVAHDGTTLKTGVCHVTVENPKLGIAGFALCDFKFLSVQALLTAGWHFTSSMIHALTLLPSDSPYYSST